ncbi:MAG: 1-(5-phosphoribosyl)-5-[(5-phosphoribosylamino)methylideneamino]imidazole-4-carboxamide isomerase [Clostridia bacterium]|jgi:phosphoribosylformimino-5-aminoimidazole carboxamide ribotide isomerase|nr:1-(5-phosphoribosyl)-5-[(5-phosphoribosylamino)methylideneamino]imidazole-4-carboxamide isomerase [Clostridia bacterium]MCX4367710.1 1-(5-phosphoribosyl)-5-[(5-phosphoribosylamino)methylideneamino]imidazole-4-carboxamide isomerase [Clostridia bacterium]
MLLFPAVDVLDNRAVRLLYGKRNEVTDYGTPLERALAWQEKGAEYLHLVDLNGAFDDSLINNKTLCELVKNISIPVEIGGGIKSYDRVRYYLEEVGASRVIIGTALVKDPDMTERVCAKYGDRIVAGIDAINDRVAIKGWVEKVDITPLELSLKMKERGVNTVIFTDISRDGALSGVNVDATETLQRLSGMNIIASGGVKNIDDIVKLKERGIYGAILGRAIYTGDLDVKEAIKVAKEI